MYTLSRPECPIIDAKIVDTNSVSATASTLLTAAWDSTNGYYVASPTVLSSSQDYTFYLVLTAQGGKQLISGQLKLNTICYLKIICNTNKNAPTLLASYDYVIDGNLANLIVNRFTSGVTTCDCNPIGIWLTTDSSTLPANNPPLLDATIDLTDPAKYKISVLASELDKKGVHTFYLVA